MALNVKDILPKIFSEAEKGNLTAFEDAYHMCLEAKKTDTGLAREYLRRLSDMIERDIPNAKDDKTIMTLFNLHKKVLLAAAPIDFESFLLSDFLSGVFHHADNVVKFHMFTLMCCL